MVAGGLYTLALGACNNHAVAASVTHQWRVTDHGRELPCIECMTHILNFVVFGPGPGGHEACHTQCAPHVIQGTQSQFTRLRIGVKSLRFATRSTVLTSR